MTIQQLKLNFEKIKAARFLAKQQIFLLVMMILSLSLLPILIVFGILFYIQAPIESNGTLFQPGSEGYLNTYYTVFIVIGAIALPNLIGFVVSLFAKPKCIMQIIPDINFEGLYIVYKHNRIEVLTHKLWLTFRRQTAQITQVTDIRAVSQELYRHFFWLDPDFEKKFKVVEKKNFVWVKPLGRINYSLQTKYYRVKFDERGMVSGYTEFIGSTSGNTQSMRDIRIAGNNQNATNDLPQPILRYLAEHSGF